MTWFGSQLVCVVAVQKEEDNIVTLLDDESRAVLGLLQRGAASAGVPPPVLQLRPNYSSELTNRPAKVWLIHASLAELPEHFMLLLRCSALCYQYRATGACDVYRVDS